MSAPADKWITLLRTDPGKDRLSLNDSIPKLAESHPPISINGNTALDIYCAGNGTDGLSWVTAHVLRNFSINAGGTTNCIDIRNTNRFLIIRNVTAVNGKFAAYNGGITIVNGTNILIQDVNASGNGNINIYIENSKNITITECQTNDAILGSGIYLYYTNYTIISNTSSMRNSYGIYVDHSSNNTICNNNASSNWNGDGIFTQDASNNNTLTGNHIINNTHNGIHLSGSSFNNITDNYVSFNNDYGMLVATSQSNRIFNNIFEGNNLSQAFSDASPQNAWDNGSVGNHWSDYTGVDANHDGIGDYPYFGVNFQDKYPLMFDNSLNLEQSWNCTWGGLNEEWGRGIAKTNDSLYLAGWTLSFGAGGYDGFLMKCDLEGNNVWNITWGESGEDRAMDVGVESDGMIYITGYTTSFGAGGRDVFLAKYNSTGDLQWNYTWGGILDDEGAALTINGTGEIYVTGNTRSFGTGNSDVFLLKYNSSGALQWNRTWGGAQDDNGHSITTNASGVFIAGKTASWMPHYQVFILKYDAAGNYQWNITWGNTDRYGLTISVTSTDIYVTGCITNGTPGYWDGFVAKFNSSGNLTWSNIIAGANFNAMAISNDTIYAANVYSIIKYDTNGTRQGVDDTFNHGYGSYDIIVEGDSLYLGGFTWIGGAGGYDGFFIKLTSIPPTFIGTGLTPGGLYGVTAPSFALIIMGGNLSATCYSIDGGLTNTTCSLTGNLSAQWGGQGSGAVTVSFWANDTYGKVGNINVMVNKDAIMPFILSTGLTAEQLCNATPPSFTLSVYDDNFAAAWYSFNGGATNFTCACNVTEEINSAGWFVCGNGTVTITFWANDLAGNVNSTNITVWKDIIGPSILGTGLVAGQVCNTTAPSFSLVIGEANLDTIWYSLDGGLTNTTCGMSGTFSAQWESYGNGTITVTFWANDTLGNENFTTVTLQKDIIAPSIASTGLAPEKVYGVAAPTFSLSIVEGNLNETWYSLDDGTTNTTCGLTGNLSAQWGVYGNGTVTVSFWANDTVGKVGTTSVTIQKDIIAPAILDTGLIPGQVCGGTSPVFSLTISEVNLNATWYSLNGGITNTTCGLAGTFAAQWSTSPNGTVNVLFWANDTAGNVGNFNITIYKDIIAPFFNGTSLIADHFYNATPPAFILDINGTGVDQIWYSLDNGTTNTTCSLINTLVAQWGSHQDGNVTVHFWLNDTVGNVNNITIVIYKDIISPSFTSTGLALGQLFNATAPSFNLSIVEGNLSTTWFSLDGGSTITNCSLTGNLSAQWSNYGNGTITVTFWANDSAGNVATISIGIYKDVLAPIITSTGLTVNQIAGIPAPTYVLTIMEGNLDATWYSLNGGLTNTTCGLTGTLAAQWGSRPNGTVTVTFWAKDVFDNTSRLELTLRKDIITPMIHVNVGENMWHADPPAFTLMINEPNLVSTWYSLDGGKTNHTISSSTGGIDLTVWNAVPLGQVTIRFYARDAAGNEAYIEVKLVKILPWWAYLSIVLGIAIPVGIFLKVKLIPAGRKRLKEFKALTKARKIEHVTTYLAEEYAKGWHQSQGRGGVQSIPIDRLVQKTGANQEILYDAVQTLCAQGMLPAYVHDNNIIFDFTPGLYALYQIAKKTDVNFATFTENLQELEKAGRLLLAFYAKNHRNPKREESWKLGVPITLLDACSAFINVAVDEEKLDIFQHLTPDERRILDGLSRELFQRKLPTGQSSQEMALSLDVLVQLPAATIVLAKLLLPFVNQLMKRDLELVHLPPGKMG